MAFAGQLRVRFAVYGRSVPCTFMVGSVSTFSNTDYFFRCRRSGTCYLFPPRSTLSDSHSTSLPSAGPAPPEHDAGEVLF